MGRVLKARINVQGNYSNAYPETLEALSADSEQRFG
jgi:hypothetical protein